MCLPVWRELKLNWLLCHCATCWRGSKCAFPFEGNGNLIRSGLLEKERHRLNVPSRLKGIETYILEMLKPCHQRLRCLNVPSRLKGIETYPLKCLLSDYLSLNVPSRLKGIETRTVTIIRFFPKKSKCAFPFEGNGNLHHWVHPIRTPQCLNVPSRLKGIETFFRIMWPLLSFVKV